MYNSTAIPELGISGQNEIISAPGLGGSRIENEQKENICEKQQIGKMN